MPEGGLRRGVAIGVSARWLSITPRSVAIRRAPTMSTIGPMDALKTLALFAATAVAEIVGCYLPYLWLRGGKSAWLLLPAALSLALFAWLLTLHPTAAGRVYAAYGGVYVCVALVWLWGVDRITPSASDWVGMGVCLVGMAIIMFGPRGAGA
jgi:small multidrug resistance family-3 protein